ncbi:hypothetical protein RMB13_14485 [Acinetobacter sp. V102_4]|uniref:hypothetical protein n=1 Tax=Acinetobacter sp. V102_4 TaxID=3072984 RepID=UPI00287BD60D|nr:hypothetical protein [Acinetobacter sp. V102_4]MDS7930658.1 hypothetical protein [Acinetobacter sp. V102_4]
MARKNLKVKVELTIFWLGLFCLSYLIFGFILKSDLTKPIDSSIFYEVLKDSLSISAAFFAPIAAFILFSDWREQHNKQVRNEFGLKVFNQFEKFSKGIDQAGFIYTELDCLLPKEARDKRDPFRIRIGLDHPIFHKNKNLILSYFKQVQQIQEEFQALIENFRYFGVVTNQLIDMKSWIDSTLEEFVNIHEEDETYSEFLQFLEKIIKELELYKNLRNQIELNLVKNILQQLQE